jgi:hypothetical protein
LLTDLLTPAVPDAAIKAAAPAPPRPVRSRRALALGGPPQRPGQADTDSQIQTAHRGGDREGGTGVDVHRAGLNSFQCPSEMTSTLPPVTLMAV